MRKLLSLKSKFSVLTIISLLLSSWTCMIVWADNESVSVQAGTAVIDADSMTSLSGAIATANANPETEYTINIRDNISMTSGTLTISNTAGVVMQSDMSLANAPFTITKNSSNNRHFTVKGTLTFNNIILDGSGIGGGVRVEDGVFHLNDGAVIQNCFTRESTSGGAISGGKQMSPTHVEYTCDITIDGGILRNNVASGTNGGGAVYINGADNNFTMKRGEIRDNKATSTSTGYGGAIVAYGPSNVTIESGTVSGNTSAGSGGGVYCNGAAGFTMTDGSITDNHSSGTVTGNNYGGGIYAGYGTVNITGGTISGNTIKGYGGGVGIYSTGTDSADINISGVTISENTAGNNGGGVFISRTNSASATASIINDIISDNIAANGGGIYSDTNSTVTIGGSIISGNKANANSSSNGGGIYGYTNSSINVSGSIITGNTANQYGGGVYGHTNGRISITGSDISGNAANRHGGGIYGYTGSSINVSGGKMIVNTAGQHGGGIYGSGIGITADNAAITGNSVVSGHGGGIYGTSACYIAVTGGHIIGNAAPAGDGGGIYTADTKYEHLTSSDTTVYSANHAHDAYIFTGTHYPDIQSASVSLPGTYVLNNYDINYAGGAHLDVYTVTYNANGGEGSYQDVITDSGLEYTVLSQEDTGISYSGHTFLYWNTEPDGTGVTYPVGSTFEVTGDIMLYAQWSVISTDETIDDTIGGETGGVTDDTAGGTPSNVAEGIKRPYVHSQDLFIEIEENEIPLENIELTEIEENKIPMTGAISNPVLIGLSCLFIFCGVICRSKLRFF